VCVCVCVCQQLVGCLAVCLSDRVYANGKVTFLITCKFKSNLRSITVNIEACQE